MKEPTLKHIPTKVTDDQWGNLWSVCDACEEKITRSYYPEEFGERAASYDRYWHILTMVQGASPNVRVGRFQPECATTK
jgi:hypothetical protein